MTVAAVVVALLAGGVLTAWLGGEPARTADASTGPQTGGARFPGVEQDGFTLGARDARITATIYTYLGSFDDGLDRALPGIVDRYVRPGQVKLQLRTLTSDPEGLLAGGDSGAAALQAAGLQDRLWDFHHALVDRHPGHLDADAVVGVARELPALDRKRWIADVRSARVVAAVRRGDALARAAGIRWTPSVVVSTGGKRIATVPFTAAGAGAGALRAALDRALRHAGPTPTAAGLRSALRCSAGGGAGCLRTAG